MSYTHKTSVLQALTAKFSPRAKKSLGKEGCDRYQLCQQGPSSFHRTVVITFQMRMEFHVRSCVHMIRAIVKTISTLVLCATFPEFPWLDDYSGATYPYLYLYKIHFKDQVKDGTASPLGLVYLAFFLKRKRKRRTVGIYLLGNQIKLHLFVGIICFAIKKCVLRKRLKAAASATNFLENSVI